MRGCWEERVRWRASLPPVVGSRRQRSFKFCRFGVDLRNGHGMVMERCGEIRALETRAAVILKEVCPGQTLGLAVVG